MKSKFYFLFILFLSATCESYEQAPCLVWQATHGGSGGEGAGSIDKTSDGGYITISTTGSSDLDVTSNHGFNDIWVVKTSSTGVIQWQKSYGGSADEFGWCIKQTSDGGYIFAGEADSNDGDVAGFNGGGDGWIVKLDNAGNIQWQQTLGGSGWADVFSSIFQTADGGYIAIGQTDSNDGTVVGNHGTTDGWVVKLSATGAVLWQHLYGGINHESFRGGSGTPDGGAILTGSSAFVGGDVTVNHGNIDCWVVKIDAAGNIEWQKSIGGSLEDIGSCAVRCTDGTYAVTGYAVSNNGDFTGAHGSLDIFVARLSSTGNLLWTKLFGGTGGDSGSGVIATNDGGCLVVGSNGSQNGQIIGNHGGQDVWLLKVDATGVLEWQKSLGGTLEDIGTSVVQNTDGSFVVFGNIESSNGDATANNGYSDIWLVKLAFEPTPTAVVTQPANCGAGNGIITVNSPSGSSHLFGINGVYQSSNVFTNLGAGTYQITCSTTSGGCISPSVSITVGTTTTLPPPVVAVTQPTCLLLFGSVLINSPTGATMEYSIGGAYQSSSTFNGLAPGTYSITAEDASTGCVSAVTTVTINTVPTLASPTASVTTSPTCTTPTGAVTVSAPLGSSYVYSIGGNYQTSPIFNGLTPGGSYSFVVKDNTSGCVSAPIALVINNLPAPPPPPTAFVATQPTCSSPAATISITSPAGTNYLYSVGSGYQASAVFSGLSPGTTYSITVKDGVTGCISAPTSVTVNNLPAPPLTPVASVTSQPTCVNPTGAITVSTPTGGTITYSIGGSYQASATFTSLSPGTSYNLTAKDVTTGCISSASNITIPNLSGPPAQPTVLETGHPTCFNPTAQATVTNPTGPSYTYSIGGVYQASAVFNGLTPGMSYNVTVKDNSTGCVSNATLIAAGNLPTPPSPPSITVTIQPSCSSPTANITLISGGAGNVTYSIGGNYQVSPVFTVLLPGNYVATVKDIVTGCTSQGTNFMINQPAGTSPAPVIVNGKVCGEGMVHLSASGTGNLQWYSDSSLTVNVGSGNTYDVFIDHTTSFFVTATNGACTSAASPVIATALAKPQKPFLGNDTTKCARDILLLTPGVYASYLWQDSSTSSMYEVANPGTYSVQVMNGAGCFNADTVSIAEMVGCDDVYFATAFTPNGDGLNDSFGPLGDIAGLSGYVFQIYDRNGELMFASTNPFEKWNGTFKTTKQGSAVFVWYARYFYRGIERLKKGWVVLIR